MRFLVIYLIAFRHNKKFPISVSNVCSYYIDCGRSEISLLWFIFTSQAQFCQVSEGFIHIRHSLVLETQKCWMMCPPINRAFAALAHEVMTHELPQTLSYLWSN